MKRVLAWLTAMAMTMLLLLDFAGTGIGWPALAEQDAQGGQDSSRMHTDEIKLQREATPVPTAEELADGYYRAIARLETDTAGATLKMAETVCDVYAFCAAHRFGDMDANALAVQMLAARELLTSEEKAALAALEPDIHAELMRLTREDEESGDVYQDAGVEKELEELRRDAATRRSVACLLSCATTLEALGQ